MKPYRDLPQLADTEVDWVLVGRLTGRFDGPISRTPTPAELTSAHRAGASVEHLARALRVSGTTMRERLGLL